AEIIPLPNHFSWTIAASLPIAYLTASLGLVHKADVKPGEWVLVHPGSGGVGSASIQLAKSLGARVIATTSSREKVDYLFHIGANDVLVYDGKAIAPEIDRTTHGEGVQVAIDGGGKLTLPQCLDCMANGGRIISYGYTTGLNATIPLMKLIGRNVSIHGIALWYNTDYGAAWSTLREVVLPKVINGQINPVIQPIHGLENVPDALRQLEHHHVNSKLVIVP
ncbi:MAG: zinc-binding dehydrogenase, partial [Symploca sp. SIO2B6]|nr:zinc-binding dehydrogenase [Symploca sp. SIO2B6]